MHLGWIVFLLCYQSFFSPCFVVAAVLEGVHFSFGSTPKPILFQLLILVQFAMPILLFFGYFTNKLREKKEYPKHLDCIFNRGTCCLNCFFGLILILLFLRRWCYYFCWSGTPAAWVQRKCCAVVKVMDKFLSLFLLYISRCYGSAEFPVLESCPTASLE